MKILITNHPKRTNTNQCWQGRGKRTFHPKKSTRTLLLQEAELEALPKSRQKLIIPFQEENEQYRKRTTKGRKREKKEKEENDEGSKERRSNENWSISWGCNEGKGLVFIQIVEKGTRVVSQRRSERDIVGSQGGKEEKCNLPDRLGHCMDFPNVSQRWSRRVVLNECSQLCQLVVYRVWRWPNFLVVTRNERITL